MEQKIEWFNRITVGKESYANVLRFEEVIKDRNGNVLNTYKNELLSGDEINKRNRFGLAQRGRMRFSCHEDMHNTLKNRGFNAKHDYARANSNGMVVWKLLMFVALFVDQLFSITRLGINARGIRSLMKFAKDLLQQLVEVPWGAIVNSPILQNEKRQFRFCFGEASG